MRTKVLASILLISTCAASVAAEAENWPQVWRLPSEPIRLPANFDCIDAAHHHAWCGPDPAAWHECRAIDHYGRCPDDPACIGDDDKQTVCVKPVVRVNTGKSEAG
jgi:hypothetical protein